MREIHYIRQPTEFLCGQACVAMIAGVSVDEVIRVMNNDKATGKKDIERALEHYGIKQAKIHGLCFQGRIRYRQQDCRGCGKRYLRPAVREEGKVIT